MVIQSYNYGGGYADYVAKNGKKHSFNLAENFAKNKSGGTKVTYTNPIAVSKNGGWRYNYGNMFYVEPVSYTHLYLRLEHEDSESYVSYFTVNAIVGELDFPSSEIFYFQQQQFTFPVDTSMNVEIVGNKKALTTVRNKKKELKDLDNHAYQAGNETSSNVVEALDSVDELETDLDQSKDCLLYTSI